MLLGKCGESACFSSCRVWLSALTSWEQGCICGSDTIVLMLSYVLTILGVSIEGKLWCCITVRLHSHGAGPCSSVILSAIKFWND